jgi:hypothetical protein
VSRDDRCGKPNMHFGKMGDGQVFAVAWLKIDAVGCEKRLAEGNLDYCVMPCRPARCDGRYSTSSPDVGRSDTRVAMMLIGLSSLEFWVGWTGGEPSRIKQRRLSNEKVSRCSDQLHGL